MQIVVYNNTGGTIAAGKVVYQTGIRYPSQVPTIALASASTSSTAIPMGITVDAISDASIGYVVIAGSYYPIDTSAFTVNADAYLSNTLGAIASSAGTVEALVGTVSTVSALGILNFSCLPIDEECTPTEADATPSVSSISPAYGASAGSMAVTLTGTNFTNVTSVTIGGNPCTSVAQSDPSLWGTELTAVTPSGTAGAQDVVVTNTTGSGTLTGGYTYIDAPTVSSITPNYGPATGSTSVTISGTNFLTSPGVPGVSSVTINGVACTSVVVGSSTSLTAVTPAGSAGAQDVVVTTAFGTGTLSSGFTYIAAPTVSTITPNSGALGGGTSVTIAGTNFLTSLGVPGVSAVSIADVDCTSISVSTSTSLTALTPAGSSGTYDVAVFTAFGSGTLASGFTYIAAPTVTSITPNSGPTAGGTSVTVVGTNFLSSAGVPGVSSVTIGGVACTSVVVGSSTSLTAVAPAGSAGAEDVVVTTLFGTGTLSSAFTYIAWSSSTKSLEFAGSSSQHARASAVAFDPAQAYSVSLWYKAPTAGTGDAGGLFSDGTGHTWASNRCQVQLEYHTGTYGVRVRAYEGEGDSSYTITNLYFNAMLPTNPTVYVNPQVHEWNHVVFTSESTSSAAGTIKLYWNGEEVVSGTGKAYGGSNFQTKPTIGARSNGANPNSYYTGNIDQVATYQRALSASDVTALYGTSRKPQTPYLSSGDPIHLWAMGEYVTGSTMPDQVGSLDMTLYSSPTVSTDIAPAAWADRWSTAFDGTDDCLKSTSSPIDVTGAFSVSLWAKVTAPQAVGTEGIFTLSDSINNYQRLRIDKFQSGTGASEKVAFRIATYDAVGGSSSQRTFYTGTGTTELAKWRHVVFTGSATSSASGTQHLYLDGVQGTSGSSTMDQLGVGASIDEAIVGAYRHFSNGGIHKWLDGNVDEISCWNRVLSQAEVTALYNSGNPTDPMNTTGVTADAVAYYRMGDRWNQGVVPDQIGSVDLTMSSAPEPEQIVPYNYYSMYHDGTDDGWSSIGTSTPTIDAFKDALSVSYWINTTIQGGGRIHMWLSPPYDASASAYYYRMRLQVRHQGSDGKVMVRVGYAGGGFTSTTTNTSWAASAEDLYGKWAHVAVTVGAGTSSDVKIYVNGTLDVTGTSPSTAWSTSEDIEVTLMALPNSASTFTGFKNGYLDEVSLYDSELSAADVTKLYETKGMASPTNLGLTPKLYYRMGDPTDSGGGSGVVTDRMGTGMDLDSLGSPLPYQEIPT